DEPRHRRYDTQSLAAALDFDRDVAARRAAHLRDKLHSIGDGLTVHRQQAIAHPQSRARAGAALGSLVNQRGGIPGREIEAESGQQLAGLGHGAPIIADPQREGALAAVAPYAQGYHAVVAELPDQRDLQLFGVPDVAIADAHDLVAALQPGHGGGTVEPHLPDHGFDDFSADHRQNGVEHSGEQQVHGGPRQ